MKIIFLFILLSLVIVLTNTATGLDVVGAQEIPPTDKGLFTAVSPPDYADPLPTPEEVIRSRYVTVDLNAFSVGLDTADVPLAVNLFPDVSWTAVRESLRRLVALPGVTKLYTSHTDEPYEGKAIEARIQEGA